MTTINLLKEYFKKLNLSYLIVSRPLNLTIIPTLLSFCENTFIKFDNILTNVGFVDTTPKKDVLCDIKYQLDNTNVDYTYQYLCDFELLNGTTQELGTLNLSNSSITNICKRIKKIANKIYFLNSPIISNKIIFDRKRPECFYPQIIKANDLIKKLSIGSNNILIDISNIGINTFDGVHFTNEDHNICYNSIISTLD